MSYSFVLAWSICGIMYFSFLFIKDKYNEYKLEKNSPFKKGDVLKFKKPLNENESNERFIFIKVLVYQPYPIIYVSPLHDMNKVINRVNFHFLSEFMEIDKHYYVKKQFNDDLKELLK